MKGGNFMLLYIDPSAISYIAQAFFPIVLPLVILFIIFIIKKNR